MPSKSKGRAPAHQNRFAFRHNPKSKKTDKILSSPNVGVCKRCHEKIEWRKKYRKYKPRTQLGKCNMCQKRNIKAAYHTICGDCSYKVSGYEKNIKMCEICTKEPVFASTTTTSLNGEVVVVEGGGNNEVDMIEKMKADLIHEKEEAENKAIRLRDKKSIDRKVQKLVFGGGGGSSGSHAQHDSDDDSEEENSNDDDDCSYDQDQDEQNNEDVESVDEDLVEEGDNNYGDDDDEDEDPFLKAIGGKEKLLVGEAYQKMLLEKQKK